MTVHGALSLANSYPRTLILVFFNLISLCLNQVATQLSSGGWMEPVPESVLAEKILGHSREPETYFMTARRAILYTKEATLIALISLIQAC